MIHVAHWKPGDDTLHRQLDHVPTPDDPTRADHVVWIDLENPTADEEDRVFRQFLPVHPLTLEDILKPRRDPEQGAHLPKVEEFRDYLFVVVNPLPPAIGNARTAPDRRHNRTGRPQLSAILTDNTLITHHYEPLAPVAEVRDYIQRHNESGQRGPDYLFHLILDAMVDDYAPVVESVADRIDELETHLFTRPARDLHARLLRLKREVTFLRKTLLLEREVLARLTRGEFDLIEPREIAYYRNVYDHLIRYADQIEVARETVSDLMQTHLTAASHRLNEIMKVLTMISTIVLPMTLIAGIYGMNFSHSEWPDFQSPWGFLAALGAMLLVGLTAVGYFKWKNWL